MTPADRRATHPAARPAPPTRPAPSWGAQPQCLPYATDDGEYEALAHPPSPHSHSLTAAPARPHPARTLRPPPSRRCDPAHNARLRRQRLQSVPIEEHAPEDLIG